MDNTSDYNQKISTNLDTIEPQQPPPSPKKKMKFMHSNQLTAVSLEIVESLTTGLLCLE